MVFADRELAKRLESAEGYACTQFAEARARLFPESGSEWEEIGGARAVFDGVDAPTTQSFGLGLFEELTTATLEGMERFFFKHGTAVMHEVSPLVGIPALGLLCSRGYRPVEVSNVMYRAVEKPSIDHPANILVREVGQEEGELWGSISARGWTHDHPEFEEFCEADGSALRGAEGKPLFSGGGRWSTWCGRGAEHP